jgi:hypothetical protein
MTDAKIEGPKLHKLPGGGEIYGTFYGPGQEKEMKAALDELRAKRYREIPDPLRAAQFTDPSKITKDSTASVIGYISLAIFSVAAMSLFSTYVAGPIFQPIIKFVLFIFLGLPLAIIHDIVIGIINHIHGGY